MSALTLEIPPQIEALIRDGNLLLLTKSGERVATVIPEGKPMNRVSLPDFRRRLRETWGERVFSDAEVRAMRDAELGEAS